VRPASGGGPLPDAPRDMRGVWQFRLCFSPRIDPQGPSRVFFAVTGGTGSYRSATGQAEYIDTDVTDIIIDLDD
jgi:hypothetical protein